MIFIQPPPINISSILAVNISLIALAHKKKNSEEPEKPKKEPEQEKPDEMVHFDLPDRSNDLDPKESLRFKSLREIWNEQN